MDLPSALTLPNTRRHIREGTLAGKVLCAFLLFVFELPQYALRGVADNAGFPRRADELITADEWLGFGRLPSERVYDLAGTHVLDIICILIYAGWFFVPWMLTLYIIAARWDVFASYAPLRLILMYLSIPFFVVLPTEPPWMAADVTRVILEYVPGDGSVDANQLAALPSLHVAVPVALSYWLFRHRLPRLGLAYGTYACLVTFSVVYLGEHYLVDAFAGAALAVVVVVAVESVIRAIEISPPTALAERTPTPLGL